jgi:hypothetical protein
MGQVESRLAQWRIFDEPLIEGVFSAIKLVILPENAKQEMFRAMELAVEEQ